MKFHNYTLLLILCISAILSLKQLHAQQLLEAKVRDAYTRLPLENVNIINEEYQSGTSSDKRGKFMISLEADKTIQLEMSHLGYQSQVFSLNADSIRSGMTFHLIPVPIEIDPVTITATLNRRKISKLPGRAAVITSQEIDLLPANNTDALLQGIANVYINRPWGIFSKGASVTMRGLPGSSRTLILLDGAPMNKAAGGTINWNFVQAGDIENIEVVKGPGSALYGNNAMGGVITMTSRKPEKALEGKVKAFGGSYGTYGGTLQLGGTKKTAGKGFYWDANGFYRTGDGYYIEPEETRDDTDAKVSLDEYNFGMEGGYSFDSNNTVGLQYRYYNGTFGTGTQILEEDGSWDRYRSHLVLGNYSGMAGKYSLQARVYYQLENFDRQNESMNSTGKYKLSDTESTKNDIGIWMNASRTFFKGHLFTAGLELKSGDMTAVQQYRTSTDRVDYGGTINFAGLFIQDEFNIVRGLSAIAGLRFDMATFKDGYQDVSEPTSNTGFLQDTSKTFTNESWVQLNPKIALQYEFNKKLNVYISASSGFMPPKVDDLAKSGKISKGFKLANPELKPEKLINYESGLNYTPVSRLTFEPSIYYSRGYDFQYFVATGDSVDTGGTDLKPVLQRQNVTEVEILGAEITARWEVFTHFFITASYAMNGSEIIDFNDPNNQNKDLAGKSLIEVPENQAYASVSWRNKIVNVLFDWQYTGMEWYDDENTQYLPPYHIFGLKLSRTFKPGIGCSLTVDNILDNVTIDRKGKQTPGRFVMAEVFFTI